MSDEQLRGSCLCGAVAYQVRAPFLRFVHCHCSRCRKATGSAHVVPAGSLDDQPRLAPTAHIFADSRPDWSCLDGSLPRHAEYTPDWRR